MDEPVQETKELLWPALLVPPLTPVDPFAAIGSRLYLLTQRRLGRLIMPVQVTAHHPTILWGYGQMERSQATSKLVDGKLKALAELRVATLVGCPF